MQLDGLREQSVESEPLLPYQLLTPERDGDTLLVHHRS